MDAGARLRWLAGAVRLTLREPADGFDRILSRLLALGGKAGAEHYEPDADWERRLHGLFGQPWPCPVRDEFEHVWSSIEEVVEARGLPLGRGTYGGWDDADPAFARAVWCLTHRSNRRRATP